MTPRLATADDVPALAVLRTAVAKDLTRQYGTGHWSALVSERAAVDPSRQRRGIGRRLVAEAIAMAREWPADAIRLDAYDAPAGAGPFYAKCGFREVARVIYRTVPLVYYERVIEPRA